ncbi:MAG: cation:proton antiporter [Alphaproteobacteria bacterium]|nr:cation:proton antiporter [Alphaproteobacteria bacterium]
MISLEVLSFFAIVCVLLYCLKMAKIGALVAFLFAGILSGPYMLNLFQVTGAWQTLGDLGVLFLWFSIGLGVSFSRLWSMRNTIFGFGASQVLLVAVVLFPFLFEFSGWTVMGAIMVALLLAMSSTSEDLQLLADRNQLNSRVGRQIFSVLLFQDLLSIPLLAMLPVLSGKSFNLGATLIDVLVLSLLLIAGTVIVGRFILTPVMRIISKTKSKELFLLFVMLNIIMWAVLLDWFGLPSGLGGFLCGMLMAETIYNHQISVEISPYTTLFLAIFFITLGMGLNLDLLYSKWHVVLIGLAGLMVLKFFAIFMTARVRHNAAPESTFISLLLAQGGEFGLLMLQLMRNNGIDTIPPADQEILIAIIVLSMMLTPILVALYDRLIKMGKISRIDAKNLKVAKTGVQPVVVICGFGRVGQIIAKLLREQNIPYVAIGMNVNSIMEGRVKGFNAVYGDASNISVLREFGLNPRTTRAVVLALDNFETAHRTILSVRAIAPRIKIFARARNLTDSKSLLRSGVYQAFPETIESSFFLGYGLLEHLGVTDDKIEKLLYEMRANNYEKLDADITPGEK